MAQNIGADMRLVQRASEVRGNLATVNSPEEIAERVLDMVRSTHKALEAELANVPDDVIASARTTLHELAKAMPGPSLADVEAARDVGEEPPRSSPDKWVGWTATTMMASLWRARHDE